MELIQIYLNYLNKITIIKTFLLVFFNFFLLDPDPGGKMNLDSLHKTAKYKIKSRPRLSTPVRRWWPTLTCRLPS